MEHMCFESHPVQSHWGSGSLVCMSVNSQLVMRFWHVATQSGTNTQEALNLMRTAAQDYTLVIRNEKVHIAVFISDDRRLNIKHLGVSNDIAIENTETAGNRLHGSDIYDQVYGVALKGISHLAKHWILLLNLLH